MFGSFKRGLNKHAAMAALGILIAAGCSQPLAEPSPTRSSQAGLPSSGVGPTGLPILASTAPLPVDPVTPNQVLSSAYQPPAGVDFRVVDIISEGVRMHGEIFTPAGTNPATKMPAVIMAHGWGGTASTLRDDAADVAKAGYMVLVFDYRGWGESDSRLVLAPGSTEPYNRPGTSQGFAANVLPLREYIDPIDFAQDWQSAIDWMMGEPGADPNRIGLRGTSYSGGHVLYAAARDPRVKAVVSQVGGMDSRSPKPVGAAAAQSQATRMARGEIGYPAPRAQAVMNLTGTPIEAKMTYAPVEEAGKVRAPTLILLVENEEYIDQSLNGFLAYERLLGPRAIHVYKGKGHYDVYQPASAGGVREDVIRRTVAWFDRHLKPQAKAG